MHPDSTTLVTIYVLRDPRDQAIRYVGATRRPLHVRLASHIGVMGKRAFSPRATWIESLLAENLTPLIEPVAFTDIGSADETEAAFIEHYRRQGCNLTNDKWGRKYSCSINKPRAS